MDAGAGPKTVRRIARLTAAQCDVLALLALVVFPRLPGLWRPLLGNFATKNVVYAMIARNWARGEAPFWRPTLDQWVGSGPSLHLTELPLPAYLVGACWKVFGGSLDAWGRGLSVAWTAAAVALSYSLLCRHFSRGAARAAAVALALSPVSLVYGQSFMLEPAVLALSVATLWGLDRWIASTRGGWLAVAVTAWSLLLVAKPFMIVLAAPALALVIHGLQGSANSGRRGLVAAGTLALGTLPCCGWLVLVAWLSAESSPWSDRLFYSLRASAAAHAWPSPLWWDAAFYQQLLRDLATVVLTPVGLLLALLGLGRGRPMWLTLWLLAMAALAVALPRKFHEMNYYFVVTLPPLCALVGIGWQRLVSQAWYRRRLGVALAALALLAAARWSWRAGFTTPDEDRAVTAAAQAVREQTTATERVLAMHGTTLDLLYYCDRRGWSMSPGDQRLVQRVAECRRQGATAVVAVASSAALDDLSYRLQQPPTTRGNGFALFRLDRQSVPQDEPTNGEPTDDGAAPTGSPSRSRAGGAAVLAN